MSETQRPGGPSGADGDLVEPEGVGAGSAEQIDDAAARSVTDPARSTQPARAPDSAASAAGQDEPDAPHRAS